MISQLDQMSNLCNVFICLRKKDPGKTILLFFFGTLSFTLVSDCDRNGARSVEMLGTKTFWKLFKGSCKLLKVFCPSAALQKPLVLLLEDSCIGKNTVYSIPEICFWKIRNTILIYHTWYKRDFRNNTEISAMNSIPSPHQPPLLSSFGISMFAYQKEIYTFQISKYQYPIVPYKFKA